MLNFHRKIPFLDRKGGGLCSYDVAIAFIIIKWGFYKHSNNILSENAMIS